ncbi:MAG: hypothetical protein MJ175_03060 [Clostridia bacterium]|nr:hypothetical protein [Clostridia bacterium]
MLRKPSYQNFLSVFAHRPATPPTLFEPFICDPLTEQLIWRRGEQLWDTPEHYADTMVSLRERTQADIVILDARRFCVSTLDRMLAAAEELMPEGVRAVVLCGKQEAVRIAESSPAVCAVGGYDGCRPRNLPFIRMDRCAEDAYSEGAAGCFISSDAETLLPAWQGKIALLGGLGDRMIEESSPVAIHKRIAELSSAPGYAVGTGGSISPAGYLSLISLLGGVIRLGT